MKVNIGKHKRYFGPYQLARVIVFWQKVDLHNDRDRLIDHVAEFLSNITWLCDFFDWIHSNRKRKEIVKIDEYDTWNLDITLAIVILPSLKKFREDVQSYPTFKNEEDIEDGFAHWLSIIDKMIFSFEHVIDSEWENDYFKEGRMDKEGYEQMENRIQEGLKLFGEYYRALWN